MITPPLTDRFFGAAFEGKRAVNIFGIFHDKGSEEKKKILSRVNLRP